MKQVFRERPKARVRWFEPWRRQWWMEPLTWEERQMLGEFGLGLASPELMVGMIGPRRQLGKVGVNFLRRFGLEPMTYARKRLRIAPYYRTDRVLSEKGKALVRQVRNEVERILFEFRDLPRAGVGQPVQPGQLLPLSYRHVSGHVDLLKALDDFEKFADVRGPWRYGRMATKAVRDLEPTIQGRVLAALRPLRERLGLAVLNETERRKVMATLKAMARRHPWIIRGLRGGERPLSPYQAEKAFQKSQDIIEEDAWRYLGPLREMSGLQELLE